MEIRTGDAAPKEIGMLDHVSLGVSELERSRQFYDAVLKPLGLVRTVDFGRGADWGATAGQTGVEFTITLEGAVAPSPGMHLCFRAPSREAVRAFYRAALEHGGRDDGAPELRSQYHPDYFAAFVLDPDGYRIEAVCHMPIAPEQITR
jgi:catechol 2,3-dioxygenase-like lactoylglutathione lyase family enzyme